MAGDNETDLDLDSIVAVAHLAPELGRSCRFTFRFVRARGWTKKAESSKPLHLRSAVKKCISKPKIFCQQ